MSLDSGHCDHKDDVGVVCCEYCTDKVIGVRFVTKLSVCSSA